MYECNKGLHNLYSLTNIIIDFIVSFLLCYMMRCLIEVMVPYLHKKLYCILILLLLLHLNIIILTINDGLV